jgi:multiple sugar transport system substrate-binding protein
LVRLRGMTWGHRRAIDPLTGTLAKFRDLNSDIDIAWEARSLAGFEFQPVEDLARNYDLIILDHPFMGDAARKGYLKDLAALLEGRNDDYIGPSLASYRFGGSIFAVPVDAAAQVAAYRPDLMARLDASPPQSWNDVIALSKRARRHGLQLAIAYSGVHGLMTFFTLMASIGRPCSQSPGEVFCDRAAAREALGLMRSLASFCPKEIFDWNSIALHEALAKVDRLAYCPAVYCYATYAEADRTYPLRFADLPGASSNSPKGSTIGGTGLAVSVHCKVPQAAMIYARFAAAAETQTSFALNHGQPARIEAWRDADLDRRFGGAYSATRATLEGAWIRPRYAGYLGFQKRGGELMEQHLRGHLGEAALLNALEVEFARSGEPQ